MRFPGGTGHLAQTLDLDADSTVQDAVDLALSELRGMERRLRAAEESLADASDEELASYGALLTACRTRWIRGGRPGGCRHAWTRARPDHA
ncbi:hypothetical protein STENM327S_01601 [Streptomyces tendae]